MKTTKFICISDTHSKHKTIPTSWLKPADCIIHAGDISTRGYANEVKDFLMWFGSLPYKYKIFIAGNHDFLFEDCPGDAQKLIDEVNKFYYDYHFNEQGIIYLKDSMIEIEGIKIWGSPIQPTFYNWAFNRDRGPHIKFHWDLIPEGMDIVVTHGPVYGHVDLLPNNKERVGCEDLRDKIELIKPKVHICGHIHCAYGVEETPETKFINASTANESYLMVNEPIEFEINK